MSWAIVASVAAPVVGGLLGGQESGGQQTSQQSLDPRMQALLYGNGGSDAGMLNDVNNLRKQQMSSGGLNPMQTAGLEMQRQTLMDPRYSAGYDQMRQQGSSLMGQPVAGNPFSKGYQGGTNFSPNLGMSGGAQMPMQQQAQQMPAAAMQPIGYTPQAAPQQAAQAPALDESALQKFMKDWQAQQDVANYRGRQFDGAN